jgi:hypothetical protein
MLLIKVAVFGDNSPVGRFVATQEAVLLAPVEVWTNADPYAKSIQDSETVLACASQVAH